MNKVDHLNNFEIFKMANELATEIYPDEEMKKPIRDKLIDFKGVLRKVLKSKSRIISHEKAAVLLDYMNPKRKWPWEPLETLNIIFEIEPSFEVFGELLSAGAIKLENENAQLIFKYLILNEVYDRSVLRFLYKVYDIPLPTLEEPFVDESKDDYTQEELKKAKKNLKTGNFKPTETPILAKRSLQIDDKDEDELEDLLADDLDIDLDLDIEIDVDLDDIDNLDEDEDNDIKIEGISSLKDIDFEDLDDDFDEDFEEDYDDLKTPSKTLIKTKPLIQKEIEQNKNNKKKK